MPEPAAPHPDPHTADGAVPPMPYPGATTAEAPSSPASTIPADGAVPPLPSEATNRRTRAPAATGRWRRMMRRTQSGSGPVEP
jgi:hypothetical protein